MNDAWYFTNAVRINQFSLYRNFAKVSFNIIPPCELINCKNYMGYTNAKLEDRAKVVLKMPSIVS